MKMSSSAGDEPAQEAPVLQEDEAVDREEEEVPEASSAAAIAVAAAASAVEYLEEEEEEEESGESAVLKLKGLPYDTTEEQIVNFFSNGAATGGESDVKKNAIKRIAFVGEPDGRPSGLVSFGHKCLLSIPPHSMLSMFGTMPDTHTHCP